jgi:hypothetical protein
MLVAAVADGAGSACHSDVGAFLATRTAVTRFSPPLEPETTGADDRWKDALCQAVQAAKQTVEREAAARGLRARDLACTLILVALLPGLSAAAQIGDGAAVAADADGRLTALTRPVQGRYANETVFLTGHQALDDVQLSVHRAAYTALALLSDGLQMLALTLPGGQPHAPFLTPFFHYLASVPDERQRQRQLTRFLCSPRVRARTDDDLTLLLAAREIGPHATTTAAHQAMDHL